MLATVALLSCLCCTLSDATRYPSPLVALFSGGLMLGAVFMTTDPVTAPITNMGRWIFGIGVGALRRGHSRMGRTPRRRDVLRFSS